MRPAFLVALLVYVAFLVIAAPTQNAESGTVSQISVWEHQSAWSIETLSPRLREQAGRAAAQVGWFLPIGLFLGLAFPSGRRWLTRLLFAFFPASALAILLSAAVLGFELDRSWMTPGPLELALSSLGSVLGAWMGVSARQGWLSFFVFFPKVAILGVLLVGLSIAGAYLAIENEPLDVGAPDVSSEHNHDLVARFRENNPVKLREGETRELELSARDLDALAAWAFSVMDATPRVALSTSEGGILCRSSARIPSTNRYLNVVLGLRGEVEAGELELELHRLRVGRIEVPGAFLGPGSALLETALRHEPSITPVLSEIRELRASEDGLRVSYGRMDIRGSVLPGLLARLGPDEAVLEAARAQLRHLVSVAPTLPGGESERFGASVETAFAYAKERSAASSPVVENSGAILALASVLGHPQLRAPSGLESEERTIAEARRELGKVTLRGRADWTQHFFVSAGLTQMSSAAVSNSVGVLKEALDADTEGGGSGFSFADLLADRAGTVFARTATVNVVRARAIQDRLAGGFRVDEFFPSADGLSEGISDDTLEARYGGVGGAEYQQVIEDIERRLESCAAYR